jgi:predicted RNA binding protein YcfA (HicA-like mRNA interferase family)
MAELPVCGGAEAVRAFQKLGWTLARQTGSHIILVKTGVSAVLSVPNHRELDRGTLRSQIRVAGITVEEFVVALKA